jgi:hypothetical protein
MAVLNIGAGSSGLPVDIVGIFTHGMVQGAGMLAAAVKSLPAWMQLLLAVIVVVRVIQFLGGRSVRGRRRA